MSQLPILIIGGAGTTSRRVNARLQARGIATRTVSRTTTPSFDWTKPGSWAAALDGVSKAYVTYQPDLAVPGALETVKAFFYQAAASGVKKLVLLSGRGEVEAEHAEQALQATTADWTILRSSWFCQNFSEGVFLDSILAGEIALPSGPAAEPFVDVDDIADVAVAALMDDVHSRRLYEIIGPRALTFAEAIGEIAHATRRDIRFTAAPPEEFRAVHHGARRPQHAAGRWRPARSRTRAPGLFGLCPADRGDRHLGRQPCLIALSSA
jgi:uncharacterized protein YbjT (DUF2867 family)